MGYSDRPRSAGHVTRDLKASDATRALGMSYMTFPAYIVALDALTTVTGDFTNDEAKVLLFDLIADGLVAVVTKVNGRACLSTLYAVVGTKKLY